MRIPKQNGNLDDYNMERRPRPRAAAATCRAQFDRMFVTNLNFPALTFVESAAKLDVSLSVS
jgi:hypothetical protein